MINTTMPPISVQSGPAAAASAASHAPSTQLSPVPQSASSVHSASGAISTHSPAEHSFPVPHSVPSATATLLTVPVVSSQESAVHGFESSESMPSHKLTSVSCRSATTGALYEAIAFESICFCTLYVTVVVAPGAIKGTVNSTTGSSTSILNANSLVISVALNATVFGMISITFTFSRFFVPGFSTFSEMFV